MNTKDLSKSNNPITLIDDLIMEFSLIIEGQSPSSEKIQKGIDLINYLINLTQESNEKYLEDKSCFSQLQTRKRVLITESQNSEYRIELEKIKINFENMLIHPTDILLPEIENIQELLLKISLPIWKEQINVLKPNQFKFIEL